jgi:Na+/proline symporter
LLAVFSLLGTLIPTLIMFVAAGNVANDPNAYDPSASAGIGTGMAILWMLWGGMWTLVWAAFAINHTLKERRRNS